MKRMLFALFVVCATALLHSAPAYSNGLICNGQLCNTYKAAKPFTPQATTVALVCFHGVQPAKDNVIVTFKSADGKKIFEWGSTQGTKWRFCFGKHYFDRASVIEICNGDANATLSREDIQYLIDNKINPITRAICLLGEEACKQALVRR